MVDGNFYVDVAIHNIFDPLNIFITDNCQKKNWQILSCVKNFQSEKFFTQFFFRNNPNTFFQSIC